MMIMHCASRLHGSGVAMVAALCAAAASAGAPAAADAGGSAALYMRWGAEALEATDKYLSGTPPFLYAEKTDLPRTDNASVEPAFMWACGIQLTALAAAARCGHPGAAERVEQFLRTFDHYWISKDGLGGYNPGPGAAQPDRYYDDNAWIVLALLEIREQTTDPLTLARAAELHRFVMSGEDRVLGGGIYWREKDCASKHTCSNAPVACAALRLHQMTGRPEHLAEGRRLYDWMRARLLAPDNLYYDNIRPPDIIEKTKWSYNAALMIRAGLLLHEITGDPRYRDEALATARAAEAHWVRADTGAIACEASFAHLLCEAFLHTGRATGDPRWAAIVGRALRHLHDHARDPAGLYPSRWDAETTAPLTQVRLLDMASASRAYWIAAVFELGRD
ncbi:MAG: glycoside hydrolase family 76 protein [Candidatus Sumerlaeaceae bacterium]|nr:glycoside hydrolase family 76 protein [Candidatus Sumerlaeaceae bacterium]